jgi:hypothetical protein
MRPKRLIAVLVASSLLLGTAAWLGTGEEMQFDQTNYYIFALGGAAANLESLSAAVEADGYTVVRYEGEGAVTGVGGLPATEPIDSLLARDRLLVIDSSRFLLRVVGEEHAYAVRSGPNGLELVFSPRTDQAMDAVLLVLLDLQRLGAIGGEVDFAFRSFAKNALKGPVPPAGARIESDLYWLTVAEDWHAFAAVHGLTLVGLRVEAAAELVPGAELDGAFSPYVASQSESVVRLDLPIDLLVSLASSDGVSLVRKPYEPVAP